MYMKLYILFIFILAHKYAVREQQEQGALQGRGTGAEGDPRQDCDGAGKAVLQSCSTRRRAKQVW